MAVIEETRDRLQARLRELQPYLDEAAQIRKLLKAMAALESGQASDAQGGQRLSAETRKLQVLNALQDGAIVRIKDLAETLQVTPGRAVQLVNELEAEGTAKRVEGGVKITPAGLELAPPKVTVPGVFRVPTP